MAENTVTSKDTIRQERKESKKNLLELALDAWEKMTDNQRNRFNDFLYRLVVKGEKFTDEQIIQMVSEGV